MDTPAASRPSPAQLGAFFLKLGAIAFGGPAAHIAMMQDELVHRRRWISADDFLELLAVANLLPGPSSTELAIFIGYRLGGFAGLLVAGTCFILPAFAIVTAIAWAYVRYGHLPAVAGVLYGVKAVVIAIVVQALWQLGRVAIKSPWLACIGVLALAASFLRVNPLVILLASAIAGAIAWRVKHSAESLPTTSFLPALPIAIIGGAVPTLSGIFLVFLKLGSVVFGSGYVLLAFLRSDLVTNRGWLTESKLLDSVAVGQMTPGPVFTTATFIGYILAGPKGAIVATLGIFAPAFVFVALAGRLVELFRRSQLAGVVRDTLNVAALGLMAAVTYQLGQAAIIDWQTAALAVIGAVLLFRYNVNSTWLILGAALVGIL